MSILEMIQGHDDLVKLTELQRQELCVEIRRFLVEQVSKTGGHLASNLGVVELTVALETVFNTAKDRLVFDVGHQSYVHKMLTGRQADFSTLRQYGGIAGFPKPSESDADAFVAGHASSSVSIALGMARARTLLKQDYHVVALLGDGAATGGMVYEGLNDAAVSGEPLIVILNDNAMSIDRNVGGMASHLSNLRTKEKYLGAKKRYRNFILKIPGGKFLFRITRGIKDRIRRMLIPTTIFESMGFMYLGPVDGHDTENLITLLRIAKEMNRPVVIHVMTQKGRGYAPAEEHPKLFHGVGKFDPITGDIPQKSSVTFSEIFGRTMCQLAEQNKLVCAITAAMPGGTGLLQFKQDFPDRMFDVGIAEEHAVSMAGGLAKQGMVPVVAIYSTFLQRAYDMILQDVSMLNLHVVLAVDRAGLVGEDGETHHGVFDIGFLRHAPGLRVLCPASNQELSDMLKWAVCDQTGPVAIRYPRGSEGVYSASAWNINSPVVMHRSGKDCAIVTYGTDINNAMSAAESLQRNGIDAAVLRLTMINPLPEKTIVDTLSAYRTIIIVEQTGINCGLLPLISHLVSGNIPGCKVYGINLDNRFISHGSLDKLHRNLGLDSDGISTFVQEVLKVENKKEIGCTSG